MSPSWKQFLVFLIGLGIGSVSIALLAAGNLYEYFDDIRPGTLPDVSAIVCPAGGRGRIRAASDLWYQYYVSVPAGGAGVPVLLISGAGSSAPIKSILAQMRKEVATVLSRRADLLLVESRSTSTLENAEEFKKIATDRSWKIVALVTSSYHMKRALAVYRAESGDGVKILSFSHRQAPFAKSVWWKDLNGIWVTLFEYSKLLFYNLREAWK
jgi:uncharacterized SAM-binding protein YcdF (DUF218 family)